MALRTLADARPFQPPAIDLLTQRRRCAVLLKPGLGKTMVALFSLLRLGCKRVLVVAPAHVVRSHTWSLEALRWAELCHLRIEELDGEPEEREVQLMIGADVIVVSYEGLMWLTHNMRFRHYFDAVVYDELSKMKHPGTKRFKRMKAWASDIPVRFGLTGSPMGNHWRDLWGEMFIVAGESALGPTQGQYLDSYFKPIPNTRDGWAIREGCQDEIRSRIRPHAFSVNARTAAAELPEVLDNPIYLELPKKHVERDRKLRRELEVELESGHQLTALTSSKLAILIRQFSSGAVYTDPPDNKSWEELHDVKVEAVKDLLEELQGEPLLCFTWFRHEAARLKAAFKGAEVLTGKPEQIDRWNRKQIELFVMFPQHGLNLQGGSSSTCWFTPPWSRELYDQGNARVARIGQRDKYVTSNVLLAGTIDKYVWKKLVKKGIDEQSVVDAVAM